jgi:hypothetical protein
MRRNGYRGAIRAWPLFSMQRLPNIFSSFSAASIIRLAEDRRKSLVTKVGLEPTPPLQGPDFESGTSAIAVALETACGGALSLRIQGSHVATLVFSHCGRMGLTLPILFPIFSQSGSGTDVLAVGPDEANQYIKSHPPDARRDVMIGTV